MKVEITHHIDASDVDKVGFHEYFYEYDIYVFSDGRDAYIARSYVDTPTQASFLKRVRDSCDYLLRPRDLRDALFIEALAYLRRVGKSDLQWLTPKTGYVPVPAEHKSNPLPSGCLPP